MNNEPALDQAPVSVGSVPQAPRRGLVLGGGGVLGAAWMVGALTALEEVHGFDPRGCEVIVGTSAGSVLTALLGCGVSVDQLRRHQRGEPIVDGPLAGYTFDYERATGSPRPGLPRLLGPGSAQLIGSSLRRLRRMPPTAVLAGWLPEGRGSLAEVGGLVEAAMPRASATGDPWAPRPGVWTVAMDYTTGRRVVFGRAGDPSGSLPQAVMASCSIPAWFAPVEIHGRRYVDGGACSATSADVLAGLDLDEVYVLAPMVSYHVDRPGPVVERLERRWRGSVTRRCLYEADKVRRSGTAVTVIGPGPDDLQAMGVNVMNASRRTLVLQTSMATSRAALRDPEHLGPDHIAVADDWDDPGQARMIG